MGEKLEGVVRGVWGNDEVIRDLKGARESGRLEQGEKVLWKGDI
jgi:hypothetical protein